MQRHHACSSAPGLSVPNSSAATFPTFDPPDQLLSLYAHTLMPDVLYASPLKVKRKLQVGSLGYIGLL